jgi:carboxylesterase
VADTLPILAGANAIDLRDGHSRAVLLIHGFGDTPQTLRYLADDLHAHGYDVRVPLLPGHGRTLAAFDRSSYNEWIDAARSELLAMRAQYPWVALGGLSMGGAIAAILAEEVRDLPVLLLIAPYLGMPWHIRLFALGHRLFSLYPRPIEGRSDRSIHDPVERTKSLAYGAVTPRALRQLAHIVSLARRALPLIVAPTLLVQSKYDNRISERVAKWAFQRLGTSRKRLILTEEGGHIITVDYGKERVFEEIRAWLRGGPGTNPSTPDTLGGVPMSPPLTHSM